MMCHFPPVPGQEKILMERLEIQKVGYSTVQMDKVIGWVMQLNRHLHLPGQAEEQVPAQHQPQRCRCPQHVTAHLRDQAAEPDQHKDTLPVHRLLHCLLCSQMYQAHHSHPLVVLCSQRTWTHLVVGTWMTHTAMQKLQTLQRIKINYLPHRLKSTKISELCTTKTSLLQTQQADGWVKYLTNLVCLIQNSIPKALRHIHTNWLIICCSDVSTTVFSNQSSILLLYCSGQA